MHHDIYLFMHHIDFFVLYFFCANLQSALGFSFILLCVFVLILAPCLGILEPIGQPPLPLSLPLGVSCSEMTKADEKLNCKRKIWAERSVVLDEVDPAIRANFESRG